MAFLNVETATGDSALQTYGHTFNTVDEAREYLKKNGGGTVAIVPDNWDIYETTGWQSDFDYECDREVIIVVDALHRVAYTHESGLEWGTTIQFEKDSEQEALDLAKELISRDTTLRVIVFRDNEAAPVFFWTRENGEQKIERIVMYSDAGDDLSYPSQYSMQSKRGDEVAYTALYAGSSKIIQIKSTEIIPGSSWGWCGAITDVKALMEWGKKAVPLDEEEELAAVMTAGEVDEIFCLGAGTARQACHRGQIRARKSGGTWLIRREDAVAVWGNNEA